MLLKPGLLLNPNILIWLAKFFGTLASVLLLRVTKHHLGACIGSQQFTTEYVNEKVMSWTASLLTLNKIGKSHPHVAYCAYVHGLANKWTYFLRTIPNISDLLQLLEDAIFHHFIPALVGKPVSDLEQALFALPVRLGGLGICNPQALADSEFAASIKVTRSLVECILCQRGTYITNVIVCQRQAKAEFVTLKCDLRSTKASELKSVLPAKLQRMLSYATETGASSWLTVLPIQEHGFALHKRCGLFMIWVASLWFATYLCLFEGLYCGTCYELSNWWLSYNPTQ